MWTPSLRALFVFSFTVGGFIAGCGGDGGSGRLGDYCDFGCAEGTCGVDGYCTRACTTDAECSAETTCGTGSDGTAACLPRCDYWAPDGFGCQDGRQVPCGTPGLQDCYNCGCGPDQRCDEGGMCLPRSEVGESCRTNDDCRTGNCSEFSRVCRVPVGSPCTTEDCDLCVTSENGWSFCSRECGGHASCNGGLCLGGDDYYTCHPVCATYTDPSCPGDCRVSRQGDLYCDCPGVGCTATAALRPEGAACRADGQCSEGECLVGRGSGYCAVEGCAACGPNTVCVDLPCVGEAQCGLRCLPSCGGASISACETSVHCTMRTTPDGASVEVCDPRGAVGASCVGGAECASGRCAAGACVALEGAANGARCSTPSDCQSNSCVSGTCRGSGLLGDACGVPADCSVGTCCSGTCQSSC